MWIFNCNPGSPGWVLCAASVPSSMLLLQFLPRIPFPFKLFLGLGLPLDSHSCPQQPWPSSACRPGQNQQPVHHCFLYRCYFPGALNQVTHICLGLEPGILAWVSAFAQPRGCVWNLITVIPAVFLVEKLGRGCIQMPFICRVCIAGAATVKDTPSSLILPTPLVIKHRMCWWHQEAWKCTVFPRLLSFTQQRGLTFKINLHGKVINVQLLALEYPQWPLFPRWGLFDKDSQAVSEL